MSYPQAPGFQPHSETSKAAADSVQVSSKRQAEELCSWIGRRGLMGATIDEGVVFLTGGASREVQASPRFRDLELSGRIVKTTEKRKTRTGKMAFVYRRPHIAPGDPAPPIPAPQYASTSSGHAIAGVSAESHNKLIEDMGLPKAWKAPEVTPYEKARDQLAKSGHGHIVARKDKTKERCGGPGLCKVCSIERSFLQQAKDKGNE